MKTIEIAVKDKIATAADGALYICGNSDYVVDFHFDSEWDAYDTKTARFVYNGTYQDQVFQGTQCPIPAIVGARGIAVGVFAGNMSTTTPAYISARRSILCDSGVPADPAPDVYAQIMELIQGLGEPDPENIAAAVADYIRNNPISETDPTVPDWAKAAEKPSYTAAEVGAISQGDLQAATDAALCQAKESGLFDGATGADGKSAYQYAQDGGYTGTEAEFVAKLAEEMPDKLPNPNALTFTGAVSGTYDGSKPMSVEIPSGGSDKELTLLADINFEGNTASVFEYTGLDDVSEIYIVGGEIKSAMDNAIASFSLSINGVDVAGSSVLDIQKTSGTDKWNRYNIIRFNGAFWESLRSPNHAGAYPTQHSNYAAYSNTVVLDVGKAQKIKLYVPNPSYKPVTGWMKIWVR